jgi:hypothetical protein
MTFAMLVFLDIGIILLYASVKNVSPFDVIRDFIAGDSNDTEQQ